MVLFVVAGQFDNALLDDFFAVLLPQIDFVAKLFQLLLESLHFQVSQLLADPEMLIDDFDQFLLDLGLLSLASPAILLGLVASLTLQVTVFLNGLVQLRIRRSQRFGILAGRITGRTSGRL